MTESADRHVERGRTRSTCYITEVHPSHDWIPLGQTDLWCPGTKGSVFQVPSRADMPHFMEDEEAEEADVAALALRNETLVKSLAQANREGSGLRADVTRLEGERDALRTALGNAQAAYHLARWRESGDRRRHGRPAQDCTEEQCRDFRAALAKVPQ